VPKGWARGQLSLREFNYKRLQVKDTKAIPQIKIQLLTQRIRNGTTIIQEIQIKKIKDAKVRFKKYFKINHIRPSMPQ
jgi:hypothetical protein